MPNIMGTKFQTVDLDKGRRYRTEAAHNTSASRFDLQRIFCAGGVFLYFCIFFFLKWVVLASDIYKYGKSDQFSLFVRHAGVVDIGING